MAYSKIILNGETLMDVTSDTVDAGNLLSGKTATKNSGAKVTGNIATKSSSDLTASGATVTAPAGYYSTAASKAVTTTTHPNPTAAIASSTGVVTATHTQGTGYVTGGTTTGTLNLTTQAAQTINTSTADRTIASYRWLTGTQTIKSVTTSNLTAANIASGVIVKVGDANNASRITQVTGTYAPTVSSLTVTPTETAQTFNATGVYGYKPVTVNAISSTYVGTGIVTRSASDISQGLTQVTVPEGYYSSGTQINLSNASHTSPTITIDNATGTVRATHTLSTGYVITGNGTTTSTYSLAVQAAQTIYPSTADQTIARYQWLTGSQTIKSVRTTNLTASNIAEGVVVKVGDTSNASRITQITGTYAGGLTGQYRAYITSAYNTYTGLTYNSKTYRSANTGFNFNNGDIIELFAADDWGYGRSIYVDGTLVASHGTAVTHYDFTPNTNFEARWGSDNDLYINTYKMPSGTYNITSNGAYDVTNYANASVSVSGGEYRDLCYAMVMTNSIYASGKSSTGSMQFQYTSEEVVSFCNSFSSIISRAFEGIRFRGSFTFANVSSISIYAFGSAAGLTFAQGEGTIFNFPSCTFISDEAFYYNLGISEVYGSNCTTIGKYAFANCSYLTTISFPKCTLINVATFSHCNNLLEASFPLCLMISDYAFQYCFNLTSIYFPICSIISNSAFKNCLSLTTINFPQLSVVGSTAFESCYHLSSITLPNVSFISFAGFRYCSDLKSLTLSNLLSMSNYAFAYCSSLVTVSFPKCTNIGERAFFACDSLTNVSIPSCVTIGNSTFYACSNLQMISLPSCSSIGNYAFGGCYKLLSLYLLGSSVVSISSYSVFYNTPISNYTTATGGVYGSIYIPASLYNSYLTATNWSRYSSRFVSV